MMCAVGICGGTTISRPSPRSSDTLSHHTGPSESLTILSLESLMISRSTGLDGRGACAV
jgi:hypothetical protein